MLFCYACHSSTNRTVLWDNCLTNCTDVCFCRLSKYLWFLCSFSFCLCVNRACFDQLQTENPIVWLVFDYICDFVYILDSCMRLRTGTDTHTHTHTHTHTLKIPDLHQLSQRLNSLPSLITETLYRNHVILASQNLVLNCFYVFGGLFNPAYIAFNQFLHSLGIEPNLGISCTMLYSYRSGLYLWTARTQTY